MVGSKQKRANRIFGRLGIRLWAIFAAGALATLIVVVLMIVVSVNAQREQTVSQQRELAKSTAVRSSSFMLKVQNDLQTVASIVPIAPQSPNNLARLLYSVQQSEPAFMDLAVIGPDGTDRARLTRADYGPATLLDRSTSEAFKAALRAQPYIGEVKSLNGYPVVELAVPIVYESGPTGAVVGLVDLTTMWDLVADVELGQRGYVYLVDSSGRLLAYRDMSALTSASAVTQEAALQAIQADTEPQTAQEFSSGLATPSEAVLAYYKPFAVGDEMWYAIVEQPMSDAFAQVNNLIGVGVTLTLVSLAAIGIMGFYISRRVTRPLSVLRKGATQLSAGKFDQQITGVKTGDELEFLAVEFNDLASKLQAVQISTAEAVREREEQYQFAQRRVREMSTLLKAGRAITSLDLENVLDNLARESAGTAGADRCSIFVLDTSHQVLMLRGWWDFEGLPRPEVEYGMGEGVVGWSARENKPLFLANAQADQRFVIKGEHDRNVAAVMNLPLVNEGIVAGVLQVSTRPGTPAFTREEQRLLGSFADQAAVAIQNAQLYEEERRRAQEMALVAEINRTIGESLDLDRTLNAILASIRSLVPYDLAEINLWDDNEKVLHTRGRGADPQYAQYSPAAGNVYRQDEGISGWLARHRQPLLIDDLATSAVKTALDAQQLPIKSVCAAPLIVGDQLVGTIELAALTSRAFTEGNLATLQTVASQSAVAIQNAQLFAETRRRVEESATLFRISSIAASALPSDELLHRIMTEVGRLTDAELGLAMVYNADTDMLEPLLAASFGDLPETVSGFRIPASHADFDKSVFRRRVVFRSEDAPHDERVVSFYCSFVDTYQVRSLMAAPLIVRDHGVGEIYIAKREVAPFTDEDQQRLSTVVTLLAEAIENFRLSAEQQRRITQLSSLGEIGRSISAALDEEEVLDALYVQLNRVMEARSVHVVKYDVDRDVVTFVRAYEDGEKIDLAALPGRIQHGGNTLTFYVCRQRQSLLLRDDIVSEAAKLSIEARVIAGTQPVRAWMGVPMISGDDVLGMISVQHLDNPYIYDQNDVNLLQSIANQASVALVNASLYAETQRRLTQLSQLSEIGRQISAALHEDEVLDVLYEQLNRMIDARALFVAYYDEAQDEIAFRRIYEEGQLYKSDEKWRGLNTPTFYVCHQRRPLLLHGDVTAEANKLGIEVRTIGSERQAQAWLGVPMIVGERVLGVIALQNFENESAYDENDLNLVQAIANQTSIALANARLYQLTDVQLSERVEELTALSAIGQELNATLEPDRIFSVVLEEALRVTGAEDGYLVMVNEETGRLEVRATQGLSLEETESVSTRSFEIGTGIIGRAAQTGEPVLVNDVRESEDYVELRTGVLSEVAVPIRYAQSVVGVLNLEAAWLDAFTSEHINFLNALAAQAAIAIGNAQRLEEYRERGELLRHRAEQLTGLFEIGQAYRSDQPIDQVLDDVVHAIQETVGFDVAVLNLLVGEPPRVKAVASAGIPITSFEELKKSEPSWALYDGILQEQFRISQSYYVPMEEREARAALDIVYAPDADPSQPRRPGYWHPDDMLIALLRGAGDRVLGHISVDKPTDGRIPKRATVETLELFANQAAIAIENANLFADLQQRLNNLTLFNEVGRSISAKLDLESLLSTVLEAACGLVSARRSTIFLRETATGRFVPRQTVGYDMADIGSLTFGPGEGLVGIVIDDPRGVIIPNVAEEPRFVQHAASTDLQSAALVPLMAAGQLIGVLSVDKPIVNGFTNTDLVILSTLADQAAVAIDNARLFEAERDQRTLAETLRDLSTVLNRTLSVSDVLDQMLAQIGRVVSYDAANIMLAEDAGRTARVVRSHGYDRIQPGLNTTVLSLRFPVRDTENLRQAAEMNKPIIVSDTREFSGWVEMPATEWVRSYVCAPLMVRGQLLGFFNLDSATPGQFTHTDGDRLQAFSAQAAVAVDNARLFEETRRNLQDQLLLYEAGQSISSTLEYDQVLEIVSAQLMRATNAQIVLIQEWDRASDQVKTIYQKVQAAEGVLDQSLLEKPFAPTDYLKVAQYLRDRRSISLRLNDDELDPLLRARMQDAGLLWTVEVPIVARDEVLGLVRLGDTRFDRELTDSEVQVIETLINQAAVAMNNARLHDQVVRFTLELEARVEERTHALAVANDQLKLERDQVETLFRIASELSTSLDLDRVLNRALELVVNAAGAAHGSILLVDPQTDVLVARAVLGGEKVPSLGRPTPFRRGEGLAGWCIINRQAAIVADVREDPRWIEHSNQIRRYRSALVVPLSVTEEVLGAMLLLHPEANYFSEVHLRLVSAASSQVATAINNAELYRYIREQAELLGGMLRAQQVESSKSQAILESVADGVMVSDAQGRVILFNAAAERILGVKRDELIGRAVDDMLGLYSAAGARWIQQVREWHASAEARRRQPILSQRIEFAGEKRFITVTVAPVTMTDEYLGSVSVFRDITAEVEADRAKTEFISTVSHELRTPMTSIKGYADLMLIGAAGAINENQQRFLSVIKSNADRLSILVNDLLDISRIETGRVKLEIKPISIESVIEAVVAALRARIDEKQQTLRVQMADDDLPRAYGDRDRVIQILSNLLSNAYQYTPPGGTLTIGVHEVDGYLQIDVSDTGIGIAPENQVKVFDRFFRADDPAVQEFAGTGLGLSIVKSLVEMHEGRIWFTSEPGAGTTFSFTLRAAPTSRSTSEPPLPDEAGERPAEPLADLRSDGRHVLVVEDDRDIAELIGRHLAINGYQVSIASRAQEALDKAHTFKPSLITLDIYLPDADGFEVLQQLKSDPETADIPVVIVSVMGDQREGLRLGAVDYLTKPIDPGRLVYAVNRVLQGPGKVLVVDDDRDTRDLLRTALEQRGFAVVLTSSGKRALTLARQERPNLILLDLKLPGLDGYEVLQRLKSMAETADIPVVVITGSLTDEELKHQKLLSLGAARFMTKPFAVDELVYEIGVLVTNRALVEPAAQV